MSKLLKKEDLSIIANNFSYNISPLKRPVSSHFSIVEDLMPIKNNI